MLKKRLIFTLLHADGQFCLSRNFSLQKVGDINWLTNQFNFETIAKAVDELFVLNVSNNPISKTNLLQDVTKLADNFFAPIAIGGGITEFDEVSMIFSMGAEKIVLNSAYFSNEKLCRKVANEFGSQAVVASVDFVDQLKDGENFTRNPKFNDRNTPLSAHVKRVQELGCGEILLRSVNQDGTGNGLDLCVVERLSEIISVPLILSGGAGKPEHLLSAINDPRIQGVATANLLNFVGTGLSDAREFIVKQGGDLAPEFNPLRETQ
jgi:cyclase